MTARRRRKSGSGPSAMALIAWVGGARTDLTDYAGTPVSVAASAPGERVAGGRAILFGRACGLAAGTLLACGSVLAGATHVGDGSLATDSASLLNPTPTTPGTTADAPAELRADAPAEPARAAPDPVRAQAVADPSPVVAPRLGPVRRNTPMSVEMPAGATQHPDPAQRPRDASRSAPGHAPAAPVAPIGPVLDPATKGVGRVAPVGGILAPPNPSMERADDQSFTPLNGQASRRDERAPRGTVETVNKVVEPLDNAIQPVTKQLLIQPATRPAMAMLTSLLPIG
jgi:hypothetical protein